MRQERWFGRLATEVDGCDEITSRIFGATFAAGLEGVFYQSFRIFRHRIYPDSHWTFYVYLVERRPADFFLTIFFFTFFAAVLAFCDLGAGAFAATIS